jgi:hypothetical protein
MPPSQRSPLDRPSETAEPGRSGSNGPAGAGALGAAITGRGPRRAVDTSLRSTGRLRPATVSGVGGTRVAAARRSWAWPPGGSTGSRRISSIEVASARSLPWSPTTSAIAPMLRAVPWSSLQ